MPNVVSRYRVSIGDEGEYEPGSRRGVLKNLLGIKSKREMDRVENEALKKCEDRFANVVTTTTAITVDLILEIHQCIFGKIYSWGGRLRSVDVSKGNFPFPPAMYLDSSLKEFEAKYLRKYTPLRSGSMTDVARATAVIHAEFLAIHPFREGNGRVGRLLAMLMIAQASLPAPVYGFTGKGSRSQKKKYLNAVFCGYRGDYEPLTRFFADALKRSEERLA